MSTNEQRHGSIPEITPSNAAKLADRVLVRLFQISPFALLLLVAFEAIRSNGEWLVLLAIVVALMAALRDI